MAYGEDEIKNTQTGRDGAEALKHDPIERSVWVCL